MTEDAKVKKVWTNELIAKADFLYHIVLMSNYSVSVDIFILKIRNSSTPQLDIK